MIPKEMFEAACVQMSYLSFSKRLQLAKMFEDWASENNIKNCPESVLAFLAVNRLIDVERAMKIIEIWENKDKGE